MPFITEEIWQSLPHSGEALMITEWPKFRNDLEFVSDEADFEKIMAVIKAIRNRRAEMNVPPSKKATVCIASADKDTFLKGVAYICRLAYASEVLVGDSFDSEGAVRVITDNATVFMPMSELVDFTAELERLKKELKKAEVDKEFFEKKLNNPGFMAKAPAALVEQQKEGLSKALDKIKMIEESIAEIESK
jgi:valyl-tRNA synthetase